MVTQAKNRTQFSIFHFRFIFTLEEFNSGRAYVQKAVLPNSKVNLLCPNTVTIESDNVEDVTPKEKMYENLWIVDKESFKTCNITNNKSKLLYSCKHPLELKHHRLVFQPFSASDSPTFAAGKYYYFIGMLKVRLTLTLGPSSPKYPELNSPNLPWTKCMNSVGRIGSLINFNDLTSALLRVFNHVYK